LHNITVTPEGDQKGTYRDEQNNRNAEKLRNRICDGYIQELQLATLNVLLPFIYTL
jgi:hypothetical protein